MPVGTAGTVKAMLPESVRGDRRRHPARQHLPPDAAARGRAGGAARRAAPLHELGAADPDRLGRVPGDEPRRAAQADRGGGELPQPRRRGDAPALARAQHGDPAAARVGHRDVLRRVPGAAGDARQAVAASMRLSMRWAARSREAFGDRPGHALFGIVQGGGARASSARGVGGGADGDRLRRLCHRRAGGRRGAGGDVRGARRSAGPRCRRTGRAT